MEGGGEGWPKSTQDLRLEFGKVKPAAGIGADPAAATHQRVALIQFIRPDDARARSGRDLTGRFFSFPFFSS